MEEISPTNFEELQTGRTFTRDETLSSNVLNQSTRTNATIVATATDGASSSRTPANEATSGASSSAIGTTVNPLLKPRSPPINFCWGGFKTP